MELRKFKEKNTKKVGIILFTISCILLISGVILYRTFAIFQVDTTQHVINGSIEDPGDIYFAFYKDGNIQKEMPRKEEGYILDEQESSCGVNGTNVDSIKVSMTEDEVIHVSGVATSRTKCNLYFVKGAYILGKGVPTVTEGNGLYEVKHDGVTGTINDSGFQKTEYRYAGQNPDNYLKFNNEDWRIIGLVNVMTNNNNVEQRVKIVKNEVIKNDSSQNAKLLWNEKSNNVHNWTNASLQELLNSGNYYNKSGEYSQYGLRQDARLIIDDVIWNTGANERYDNTNTKEFYVHERSDKKDVNEITWKGKIGLIYPSDYGYATSGKSIVNREECLNTYLYENWNNSNCYVDDWLMTETTDYWTLMPCLSSNFAIMYVNSMGGIWATSYTANSFFVKPALYLKPTVKISKGSGKNTDAFTLNYEIN